MDDFFNKPPPARNATLPPIAPKKKPSTFKVEIDEFKNPSGNVFQRDSSSDEEEKKVANQIKMRSFKREGYYSEDDEY